MLLESSPATGRVSNCVVVTLKPSLSSGADSAPFFVGSVHLTAQEQALAAQQLQLRLGPEQGNLNLKAVC